jgi:hypothetical protein
MYKPIFPILLMVLFVTACSGNEPNLSTLVESPGSQINMGTVMPFISSTSPVLIPTQTVIRTATATNVPTRVFDRAQVTTRTPVAPAQCPSLDPDDPAPIPDLIGFLKTDDPDPQVFEAMILSILNAGQLNQLASAFPIDREDITGDGISEVIIQFSHWPISRLLVFGCIRSSWKTLLVEGDMRPPFVVAMQDMNLDGVKELVIHHYTCDYCSGVRILEWDGQEFQSLIRTWTADTSMIEFFIPDMAELDGFADVTIKDIDHNGTYELILSGGAPSYMHAGIGGDGPWRTQSIVFMWDGQYFRFHSQKFDPPNFRFEAVQDGDASSGRGNYNEALASYQEAIFSEKLKSWDHDIWRGMAIESETNVYPDINKMPFNQTEYDQLSAYARYRIMLLHLVQGHDGDAAVVYKTLQTKYPEDNAGYPYVELATMFWDEYQLTKSLTASCAKVIDQVSLHSELLVPLGDPGNQGLFGIGVYHPIYVCPFKDAE